MLRAHVTSARREQATYVELGIDAEIFDKGSTVGGTWSPEMSYHALALHSPRWINCLTANNEFFPFKRMDRESLDTKADAKEMHELLNDFVDKQGLKSKIHCKSLVTEVSYHTKSDEAFLKVTSDGKEVEKGPYKLVVFASLATKPAMPDIANHGFEGKVIHSSAFKDPVMQEILAKKQRVLVLGGGKSGCDMICTFQKQCYENVTWLFRAPYWFLKMEAAFHRRTLFSRLRSFVAVLLHLLFLISDQLALFSLWLIGFLAMPMSKGAFPSHFDGRRFHQGVLDERQVDFIQRVDPKVGEINCLGKKGMILESGEVIPCDVVICATGYETGFDQLRLLKDGVPVDVRNSPLYHHAIIPSFPCLLSATTAFYHFGPIRGLTLAQYISYYLNERPSAEIMLPSAQRNWCRQSPSRCFLFGSDQIFIREFLLMMLDFVRGGILPLTTLVWWVLELYVGGAYKPLELSVGKKAWS
ncbi:unnamed protein product [Effrenium voratum]|nr:unnamed protein product [Effrenium voratum]